jgi:hypothetical protein
VAWARMGTEVGPPSTRSGAASRCGTPRLRSLRLEPAATIAGFALNPLSASTIPQLSTAITHLREVLGNETYESLARKGETMATAAMVTFAYDQIDQARTELEAVSK